MQKSVNYWWLLFFLISCQQPLNYTIKGDLSVFLKNHKDVIKVDSIYLMVDSLAIGQACQLMEEGQFELSGEVEEPFLAQLRWSVQIPGGVRTHWVDVVLEPGNLTFVGNEDGTFQVMGTPQNDTFRQLCLEFSTLLREKNNEEARQLIREYCISHKNEVSVIRVLGMAKQVLEAKELLQLIELCPEQIQQHRMVRQLNEKVLITTNAPKEGELFKDFEGAYQGKTVRFSDYVGCGKYVLVDFWASWCRPCREEIPNLVSIYQKYKDKGLVVLGVAVNDKPEDTQKIIDQEHIPYPQIVNTQMVAVKLYDIQSIPRIMLFAPDGKILSKNLRGEALDHKLKEIFLQ